MSRLSSIENSSFTRWRTFSLLAVLSLLASFGFFSAAYASSHLNCDVYAKFAVMQQQQNIDLECKFKDGSWSVDYQVHFNWCNTSAQEDDLIEREWNRSEAIGQCFDAKAMMCQGYADGALQAYHFGLQQECGFTDALVANDYEGHFDWCIQAPDIEVQHATNNRDTLVQQCKSTKR